MTEKKQEAPPDPERMSFHLRQRHRIPPSHDLAIRIEPPAPGPRLSVIVERPAEGHRPRSRYSIMIMHVSERPQEPQWEAVVEAAGALLGMLVESGYAYRDLPGGDDVQHGEHTFVVEVEATRPDLDAEADRILGGGGS